MVLPIAGASAKLLVLASEPPSAAPCSPFGFKEAYSFHISDQHLSDRHLLDGHLLDRHLLDGHLSDGHLSDGHLSDGHF